MSVVMLDEMEFNSLKKDSENLQKLWRRVEDLEHKLATRDSEEIMKLERKVEDLEYELVETKKGYIRTIDRMQYALDRADKKITDKDREISMLKYNYNNTRSKPNLLKRIISNFKKS